MIEKIVLTVIVVLTAFCTNIFWYKKIDSETWGIYGIYSIIVIILFLFGLIST